MFNGDNMNTKKYFHDKQDLIREAESILRTADENEKYLLRVRAVLDVLTGGSKAVIARQANCSVKTLENWVNWADDNEKGFQFLRFDKSSGRKSKLTENQKAEVVKIINETFPFEYGKFNSTYWSGILLSGVLSDLFGIHISPRKCREYLHDCGYEKPIAYPYNIFGHALFRTNIDVARQLLASYRNGKTEREIKRELNTAIQSFRAEATRADEEHNDDDYEDEDYEDEDFEDDNY